MTSYTTLHCCSGSDSGSGSSMVVVVPPVLSLALARLEKLSRVKGSASSDLALLASSRAGRTSRQMFPVYDRQPETTATDGGGGKGLDVDDPVILLL
ncbi:hypothetical protein HanRHA438_Chr09g0406061 [Helianthus annuus]|nr:hypothetical protein HanRHA438_Chr09g0406061 [Helianthus annuus]